MYTFHAQISGLCHCFTHGKMPARVQRVTPALLILRTPGGL